MNLIEELLLEEGYSDPPRFDHPSDLEHTPFPDQPLKLETRGISPQISQAEFWTSGTVYKHAIAAKLREIGMDTHANTLENCHTHFTISVCTSCNKVQKFPNRCDNFFCPECQPRQSADRRRAVEWWTKEIRQPKHVVLTVKNIPDLTRGHVLELRAMFTRLRRMKVSSNWLGGFYSIEVTNEGRGWHLHIHALVDAHWIDAGQLALCWQKASRMMGRIVHVRDARGCDYLKEVTKYVAKGVQIAQWTPSQISTFIHAFTGVRTFGVFGSLFGKRTEFREYWKEVRDCKPICSCGCTTARLFTEAEWFRIEHFSRGPERPRGPKDLQPELLTIPQLQPH